MNWKDRIRERFSEAGSPLDEDVLEELSTHAESAYDAVRAEGAAADEALRRIDDLIRSWLRNPVRLHRQTGSTLATLPVHGTSRPALITEARYAFRILLRQRGFAALVTGMMALGIGVTTTLFSVAYGVLLRPLPWPAADQLVRLSETRQGATRSSPWSITNGAYLSWRNQPNTVEGLAAWNRGEMTLTGTGTTDRVSIASVSASLFPLLRSAPLAGRLFTEEDELLSRQEGRVILSYAFWRRRFGADPNVIGKTLNIEGRSHRVLGIMPQEFVFPDRATEAWVPFSIPPVIGSDAGIARVLMFSAIARLRPGITPAQASAEATARARAAEQRSGETPSGTRKGPDPALAALAFFGSDGAPQITAVPVLDALTQEVRPAVVVLAVAGALLLVTAMANVVSLQLARASSRIREIAIQSAIGAGTRRIAGHFCLESLLLGVTGGVIGFLFTAAVHAALPSLLPAGFPRLEGVSLDWTVLMFATALTLGSSVGVGLLPALHLRRLNLVAALMEGGSGSTRGKPGGIPRLRMAIIVAQIAIACVLLVGGSLLSRSFMAMTRADRGFDLENILTAPLSAPDFAFTPERRIQTLDVLMERLRSLPGSPRIAFTTGLPLFASENLSGFRMPSPKPPVGTPVQVHAVRSVVTHDFFAVMGMRVVEGRAFDQRDSAISPKVVLVNRTFARQYLSDTPLGDRISNFAQGDGIEFDVIGIVEDVLKRGLNELPQPEIYSLNLQMTARTFNPNFGSFVFRTPGDPHSLIDALKTIVHNTDPSLTLRSILTLEDRLAASLARPRLYAVLSSGFALSALIIAYAGLFGVLSYTVTQRQRELAVRTALGARPRDIVRLVLRQAVVVVGVGLTLGIAGSLVSASYLDSLLYGVKPYDWINVTAVSLLTAGVALLACLIPALRAARVDPLLAIRS